MSTFDPKHIDKIIQTAGKNKRATIPILQAIQGEYNYLPQEALEYVCINTEITPSQITGVASFYSQFRFEPLGENLIKVCTGTACHVKGAELVYDAFKRELGLGENEHTDANKKYSVEKVSCLGCCTIAPAVQINNITYGHVSTDQITDILHDFEQQKNKKKGKAYRTAKGKDIQGEIRIGLGSCCVASGSLDIKKEIEKNLEHIGENINLKPVGCVGMCHQVPLVEIVQDDKEPKLYTKVRPEDIKQLLKKHFPPKSIFQRLKDKFDNIVENLQYETDENPLSRYNKPVRDQHISTFLGEQKPIATEHRGILNPIDIDEYISRDGFAALEKLKNMSPNEIIETVKNSGIRGRGGAGFLTGRKWEMVARVESEEKYLICNGDEGDPGAFMDRMLLESYPFRIIEGILIAAKAIKASKGFLYIRAEYPLAVSRMKMALEICREREYFGFKNKKSSFDIEIVQGAGAFVCGEETALIESIEGRRGFPRLRPPYPAEHGLFGKPTLVNNTETFAQISYIINHGDDNFSRIGSANSKGTKVFSLAGKVQRGGLIEVPMGMTIRHIVEEIGGGVANGKKLKAVQIGGPSGGCVPHWLADTPVDYQSLTKIGAMMGSGGLVVLDETDCMVDIARYFLSFTQEESCGKCTFCRIGTRRMLDILENICAGKGKMEDLDELEKLAGMVKKGSICGLGKSAPNPVLTTLHYFRDEYEAHINGVCPTGKCTQLITYSINDDCIGCTKCTQQCPVDAIPFTPHEKHTIDNEICIRCDACRQVCPENAIIVK